MPKPFVMMNGQLRDGRKWAQGAVELQPKVLITIFRRCFSNRAFIVKLVVISQVENGLGY